MGPRSPPQGVPSHCQAADFKNVQKLPQHLNQLEPTNVTLRYQKALIKTKIPVGKEHEMLAKFLSLRACTRGFSSVCSHQQAFLRGLRKQ